MTGVLPKTCAKVARVKHWHVLEIYRSYYADLHGIVTCCVRVASISWIDRHGLRFGYVIERSRGKRVGKRRVKFCQNIQPSMLISVTSFAIVTKLILKGDWREGDNCPVCDNANLLSGQKPQSGKPLAIQPDAPYNALAFIVWLARLSIQTGHGQRSHCGNLLRDDFVVTHVARSPTYQKASSDPPPAGTTPAPKGASICIDVVKIFS